MLIDDNTARFLKPLSAIMHKRVKNKRNITHSAGVYLLKVNNTKTGTWCEICSKWRHQNEAIGVVLVSWLLTLNKFYTLL